MPAQFSESDNQSRNLNMLTSFTSQLPSNTTTQTFHVSSNGYYGYQPIINNSVNDCEMEVQESQQITRKRSGEPIYNDDNNAKRFREAVKENKAIAHIEKLAEIMETTDFEDRIKEKKLDEELLWGIHGVTWQQMISPSCL